MRIFLSSSMKTKDNIQKQEGLLILNGAQELSTFAFESISDISNKISKIIS